MTKSFQHTLLVILLIVSSSFSTFFSGCEFDKIKSKTTVGNLDMTVDDTVEPLMKKEKAEYERINPDARLLLTTLPTSNCMADLLNNKTKIITVTRDFDSTEKRYISENKIDVKKYEIAIDGVGFIVNNSNPVSRVTSEDLKKIFTGEFKNWTDIKAQDEEQNKSAKSYFTGSKGSIKVFIQRPNSTLYSYVKDSVMNKLDYVSSAVICSTSAQMLQMVRENNNSIGITNMAWLSAGNQDSMDATVKALRVSKILDNGVQKDFVQFHQGYIYNDTYPYRFSVFIMTTEGGIGLTTGFLSYILKPDGQKVILNNGLVPVSQPVRTIQLN